MKQDNAKYAAAMVVGIFELAQAQDVKSLFEATRAARTLYAGTMATPADLRKWDDIVETARLRAKASSDVVTALQAYAAIVARDAQ